ncbi:MAG: Gfo/Idh/MocA family oxidoreductase [bacterium]|nr:Gfo/Idh/MocA family oxidoreductase [bacterium]
MTTRRRFLAATATTFAAAQSQKIPIGLIGCGWYGLVDLKAALAAGGVEVAALCDVDTGHLAGAATEIEKLQGARPQTYASHNDLLDHSGLQAVIIATPPHWHALQFIDACEKGLDIYQEKPLSYDIREGRAMVDAAQTAGNIVQVGFQRRQSPNFQAANNYIREGKAGRIVQVDVNIHYSARMKDAKPQAPPASLDWDTWCGPAPLLPYSPNIAHRSWRLEAAYGNGHLVDWGIHLIDQVRVALEETIPRGTVAVGGLYKLKGQITTPDTLTAQFEFAKAPVVWRHRLWGSAEYDRSVSNGIFYYGEEETVFASDRRWMIIPQGRDATPRELVEPARHAGETHMAEFLEAVRTRKQPSCQPEDAFRSTSTVHLGMLAYQTASRVEWDGRAESIRGNPSAARLLKRAYRAPYKHPG